MSAAAAAPPGVSGGGVEDIWANDALEAVPSSSAAAAADGDDTRSPLPAAAATAPAAATTATTNAEQQEISEETYRQLEAAAYTLSFSDFCDRLQATQAARGAGAKREAFFFRGGLETTLQRKHNELNPPGTGKPPRPSLYPLFKLLIPSNDPRSGQYKLKEKMLAGIYCKALNLRAGMDGYHRLNNYTDKKYNQGADTHDIGDALYEVARARIAMQRSQHTLADIDRFLDDLVKTGTDREKKQALFDVRVIEALSAREHKWLARIILGDMKVGLKKDSALKVYGEDGPQRFEARKDLRLLCAEVALGIHSGSHIVLETPFEVHLAKRVKNASKALEEMGGQAFVMERKVDGERYCIHKKGDKLTFVSRNLKDARMEYYTHFQRTVEESVLVEQCVLDGEVVAVNKRTGEHEAFGHNKTVAISKYQALHAAGIAPPPPSPGGTGDVQISESSHELVYIAFDVVYLGGKGAKEAFERAGLQQTSPQDVCKLPLHQRRALLKATVDFQRAPRMELIPWRGLQAEAEEKLRLQTLADFFQEAVEKGWEGLVCKRLNGPYQTGKKSREVGGWVKLKPEYGEETMEFDLVLLGATYGEGMYSGIGSLSLGIIAEEEDAAGEEDNDDKAGDSLLLLTGGSDKGEADGVARPASSAASAAMQPPPVARGASSGGCGGGGGGGGGKRGGRNAWPEYRGTSTDGKRLRFHSFCRCSSGQFKRDEREPLLAQLEAHWIRAAPEKGGAKRVPPWIMPWKPSKDDFPDLWIHPDHAVVISVKAAEIRPSDNYSLKYTLRFPRITRLRPDKRVSDAMTLADFRSMRDRPLHLQQAAAQAAAAAAGIGAAAGGAGGGGGRKKRGGGGGGKPRVARNVLAAYAIPEQSSSGPAKGGGVFEGLEVVVYHGEYRTTHPKAAEYLGIKPKKKPKPPSSSSSSIAAGTPAAAPTALEVTKREVCNLLAKHGAKIIANATVRPPSASNSQDDYEMDGCNGGGKRKRGGGNGKEKDKGKGGGNKRAQGGGGNGDGLLLLGKVGDGGMKERVAVQQDFLVAPTGEVSRQLKAAMELYEADIFTLDWLLDCIQADRRVEPRVEHLLSATQATAQRLRKSVDCYGDLLEEEGDAAELAKVMARLPPALIPDLPWRQLADLHLETEAELSALLTHNLFAGWGHWVFYLDRYADPGPPDPPEGDVNPSLPLFHPSVSSSSSDSDGGRQPLPFSTLDATAALLRLHGATVSPTLHADVTHVVVDKRCSQRFALLKARLDELRRPPWEAREKVVVDAAWVEECAQRCHIVDKEQHHLVSLSAPAPVTDESDGEVD